MSARLPSEPLRTAFLASGRTIREVCMELGWFDGRRSRTLETGRLNRALGIGRQGAHTISVAHAHLIAAAIGIDLSPLYPAQLGPSGTLCSCGEPLWEATGGECGFCSEERALGIAC